MILRKASAGSGKTYLLSNKYVEMLLGSKSEHPYRHILAVTFTNKATAEMKSRIIKVLRKEAETKPEAARILQSLLHDYSAFAVSTIDRFFQQALKAFAREIGQFADYQVELDKLSLINEAMDRILDSLTGDDKELLGWIMESVAATVEGGGKVRLEDSLYNIGKLLKSEEHRRLAEEYGISETDEFTKTRLTEVRRQCRKVIGDFEKKAVELGVTFENGKMKEPGKTKLKENPALAELFGEQYKYYVTARILESEVFCLGLASEFAGEFRALLREKNVICLDESNRTLHDIIDGSDAPFVYEKLGVRFEHFLLDEFQDTSHIQWDNFLPLLKESKSGGHECLIVGDVKQSIYRWRDSDWSLLDSGVRRDLGDDLDEGSMQFNYRSCPEVVDFNNSFFEYAARMLGLENTLYRDVHQYVPKDREYPQRGNVKVDFVDDQLEAVLESVKRARNWGAKWSDIGILVRGNAQGGDVAEYLIAAGIPVLSDDSLRLSSSLVVRRLVSLLSAVDNPDDKVNTFLAADLGLTFPRTYHSIVDLCENILRDLRRGKESEFDKETLYIQAFMDDVQDWSSVHGNNLREYLSHYASKDIFVSSPSSSDSVRIMTIHKAKGLEFKYTIFPFADKVELYRPEVHWCRLDTKGSPFSSALDGLYPVNLTSTAGKSLFADSYEREKKLQAVDNMNIFYVALTRAENCLHIIADKPSATCRKAVGRTPHYSNFSELLFNYLGGFDNFEKGEPFDFNVHTDQTVSDSFSPAPLDSAYVSYAIGSRLVPSSEASDFFGPDGLAGMKVSPRMNGIVLHSILEKSVSYGGLDTAFEAALGEGLMDRTEVSAVNSLLSSRMASHPEWFDPGLETLNEVSLIAPDGSNFRPDRVVLGKDGKVSVVDYKFGAENPDYLTQVKNYVQLYRQLGYANVEGYVWYVYPDKTVKIL